MTFCCWNCRGVTVISQASALLCLFLLHCLGNRSICCFLFPLHYGTFQYRAQWEMGQQKRFSYIFKNYHSDKTSNLCEQNKPILVDFTCQSSKIWFFKDCYSNSDFKIGFFYVLKTRIFTMLYGHDHTKSQYFWAYCSVRTMVWHHFKASKVLASFRNWHFFHFKLF